VDDRSRGQSVVSSRAISQDESASASGWDGGGIIAYGTPPRSTKARRSGSSPGSDGCPARATLRPASHDHVSCASGGGVLSG